MTTKKDIQAQLVLLSLGQLNAAQEAAGVLTIASGDRLDLERRTRSQSGAGDQGICSQAGWGCCG